ncbi:MAG: hypothetical protein BA863_03405 [Desulfovibrio sp. S3730MH75]|nr:MAG: hypothetical protein BA863_03405 [Desulfovibrio sp. S3730MH75]
MRRSEILLARRIAQLEKLQKDKDLKDLHLKVFEALSDPNRKEEVLRRALKNIDMWEYRQLCSQIYIKSWREILQKEGLPLKESLVGDYVEGIALRQNTPFGFLLRDENKFDTKKIS